MIGWYNLHTLEPAYFRILSLFYTFHTPTQLRSHSDPTPSTPFQIRHNSDHATSFPSHAEFHQRSPSFTVYYPVITEITVPLLFINRYILITVRQPSPTQSSSVSVTR